MADAWLAVARATLGLGLLGALAVNGLSLWPSVAARVRPAAASAPIILLLVAALAQVWLNQRLDGRAWRWGSAEAWSAIVLLAWWGGAQTQGRARRAWLVVGLLAGAVALARLVAG